VKSAAAIDDAVELVVVVGLGDNSDHLLHDLVQDGDGRIQADTTTPTEGIAP
jgi:hypothetical protein